MLSYSLVVVVVCLIPLALTENNSSRNYTSKEADAATTNNKLYMKDEYQATDKGDTVLIDNSTLVNTTLVYVNSTYTNDTDVATVFEHITTNTTVSFLDVSSATNSTASFLDVSTEDTNKTLDGYLIYNNVTAGEIEKNVVYDPTDFPPLVQDIDEGLVAGMSVLVVALFGGCILFGAIRICYKNRQRKTGSTFYEEVEDAATSCSIEGSSNVKFLIARARNINKSRIEQINEEWRTGKPLIIPASSDMKEQSSQDTEMEDFSKSSIRSKKKTIIEDEDSEYATAEPEDSKSSIRSKKKTIIEDEDSEYATAEPEEDLYSLAGSEGHGESNVTSSTDNVKTVSNIIPNISRLEQLRSQRSQEFYDEEEDPYEEGPEDEYDVLGLNKKHKILSVSSNESCDDDMDEHLYELTDETEYNLPGNTRPRLREPLHRSKSQDRLTEKVIPTQSSSQNCSEDNVYDVSFEGEYDLLNKPRFRITISSDKYDSVQLPWECDNVQSETKTNQVSDSGHFDALENSPKAESNMYSDMESLLIKTTDKNANEDHTADDEVVDILNETEQVVHELNGNYLERGNDPSAINNNIENNSVPFSGRGHIPEERPYSFASQISSGFSSESSIPNLVEKRASGNNNFDKSFCDKDYAPVVVQNKCFELKIENGNISGAKINGLDLNETVDDEIIDLAQNC